MANFQKKLVSPNAINAISESVVDVLISAPIKIYICDVLTVVSYYRIQTPIVLLHCTDLYEYCSIDYDISNELL